MRRGPKVWSKEGTIGLFSIEVTRSPIELNVVQVHDGWIRPSPLDPASEQSSILYFVDGRPIVDQRLQMFIDFFHLRSHLEQWRIEKYSDAVRVG